MNKITLGLLVAVFSFCLMGVGAVSAQEPVTDDANNKVGWFEQIKEKFGKHPYWFRAQSGDNKPENWQKPPQTDGQKPDKPMLGQKPPLPDGQKPPIMNKPKPELSIQELEARRDQMLEKQAGFLGLTVEELRAKLEAGQKLPEIAQELGITKEQAMEQKREQRQEMMRQRIGQLVEDGKITQEQADERMQKMQERIENPLENRPHKPAQNNKPLKKPGFIKNLGSHVGQWFGSLFGNE